MASDPNTNNHENQRQHKRVDGSFEVFVTLEGASSITSRMGEVVAVGKNISEGGLYMELKRKEISDTHSTAVDNFLLFKSVLNLRVVLPDSGEAILAQGKSVWIEKETQGQPYNHGVAVAFTSLPEAHRAAIKHFVALNG
jgi:PilZ domain